MILCEVFLTNVMLIITIIEPFSLVAEVNKRNTGCRRRFSGLTNLYIWVPRRVHNIISHPCFFLRLKTHMPRICASVTFIYGVSLIKLSMVYKTVFVSGFFNLLLFLIRLFLRTMF